VEDLCRIIVRAAGILGISIQEEGALEIARRSRGTPRVANRLLKRVSDYALVRANGVIDDEVAARALEMFEIDLYGLDLVDRMILDSIIAKFNGGPVGLDTLAASVSEETDTVTDVYEPYLLKLGLIQKTPRGRMATAKAYKHMGYPLNPTVQNNSLFGEDNGQEQ
jgi:Holliday junction DNA helicase RuvB